MKKSHRLGSLRSLWSRPRPSGWQTNPEKRGKARAQRFVSELQVVARLERVRARAYHVLATPLQQPRAATSSPACSRITWAPARWPPALTRLLLTPPQPGPSVPKFPLHWLGFTLRPVVTPLIWLLNYHRLSSTQAPPFDVDSHASEEDHTPPLTSQSCRVPPRGRASPVHWLNFSLTPPLN